MNKLNKKIQLLIKQIIIFLCFTTLVNPQLKASINKENQRLIEKDLSQSIDRNQDLLNFHSQWLDAHVELQPFEFKKKSFENMLKIIVGENQGIKDICTWKRKKKKQLTKSILIKYDLALASNYISLGDQQLRFKVNDYRPYPF